MRFLMVCMRFPTAAGESYLTTELAEALIESGNEVQVLHLDWNREPDAPVEDFITAGGVRVVRCSPTYVDRLGRIIRDSTKFVFSGRRAAEVLERRFDLNAFDAAIAWMPAIAIAP